MSEQNETFRLPRDISEKLFGISKSLGMPLEELARGVISDYIRQHELSQARKNSARRFKRCSTDISTMVYAQSEDRQYKYDTAKMLDISLCGVRLSFPEKLAQNISITTRGSCFEIIFSIEENGYPIYMKCKVERTIPTNGQVEIGASFTNCDPQSLSELRKHVLIW